jgi:hypothetical protein
MTQPAKQLVALTDDNWRVYFSFIFPDSLVKGLTIGRAGIDRYGPEVEQLLAWVAEKSDQYQSKRFEISREDAAAVLESRVARK